jgi:hypothetical protein
VPYKVISKFRTKKDPLQATTPCVGSNAVVEKNGTVNVGDVVYVTKMLGEGEARVPFADEEEKESGDQKVEGKEDEKVEEKKVEIAEKNEVVEA